MATHAVFVLCLMFATNVSSKAGACTNATVLDKADGFPFTLCSSAESPECLPSNDYLCRDLDFYSFTGTDVDICGCAEAYISSNIVVLIDGTNHSNDYSWYFWSISLPKLWYYDIIRYQPLINITFVYYGSEVQYVKHGDPSQFFGADWHIPTIFADDETPNLCNAFDAAMDIFNAQKEKDDNKKSNILILLANTTPYLPNNNDVCSNNVSALHDVDMYAVKLSPNVNLSAIEQNYVVFDECVNVFESYRANWSTYFDADTFSYKPNLDAYNYLNLIVSTLSDFVCLHSDICQYIYYSSDTSNKTCSFSCVEDDFACAQQTDALDSYYIVEIYDGSQPKPLTQNESNHICQEYFNTSLASMRTQIDETKILSLMHAYNSSVCWIGFNNFEPIFNVDDIPYFEWIDGTINAYNKHTHNNDADCVSILSTGEWITHDCNETHAHCFICNAIESQTITVSISHDKYHVIHSNDTKTRQEANQFCMKHYSTHLSTIQSEMDQNDIMNALHSMQETLNNTGINSTYDAWIGDTVIITYDDCNDYTLNELWADGSSYDFTLLDYESILDESCAPTIAPSADPFILSNDLNTTEAGIIFQAPISPTKQATNRATFAPTIKVQKYCSVSLASSKWNTRRNNDTLNLFACNVFDRTQYLVQSERYYVFYGTIAKTWIESDTYCLSIFGTKLSTIYQASDQNEIISLRNNLQNKSLFLDSEIREMWIGLKLDDAKFAKSNIEWQDGSQSNYSRLNSGCLAILESDAWIMSSCNNVAYMWSCNNFIPTQQPTISPTIDPTHTQNTKQDTYLETMVYTISTNPFETFYILLVSLSLIVSIFAFCHSKNILCTCCCGVYYADDARWTTVIVYALQIWDFLSDCSFAYNIKAQNIILFILSSSFILVPWLCNVCFLFIFRYQHSINTNFETHQWFRNHSYKLVILTMLCGSANAAINLMNSRIFGANMFNMALTKLQLIETTKFKLILNTLLENSPQIAITSYYMIITDNITDFAVMALISSTASVILAIVVTIMFSIDPMQDEYIEMILKYNDPLEDMCNIEKSLLKKFGFHNKIAQSLAYSFGEGLNKKLVNVDKHKYNVKRKTISLLVSINNTAAAAEKQDGSEFSIVDNLIHKMDNKHATLMVIKLLEAIKCSAFSHLFYQINLIPFSKNGVKKLPISKKIKLDPNLMSDFTIFDENSQLQQISSSLLRAGSDPMQSGDINRSIYDDDDNDEDEIFNINASGLPPRSVSTENDELAVDQQEIEMIKQLSRSTRL